MRHEKEHFDTWHEKRFNVCEYSGVKTINKNWKELTRNHNWVTSGNLNYHRALTLTDKRGKEPTRKSGTKTGIKNWKHKALKGKQQGNTRGEKALRGGMGGSG